VWLACSAIKILHDLSLGRRELDRFLSAIYFTIFFITKGTKRIKILLVYYFTHTQKIREDYIYTLTRLFREFSLLTVTNNDNKDNKDLKKNQIKLLSRFFVYSILI